MDGFEVYKTYLALKLHFSKDNYNFFTFNGKSRASVQSFEKRKDKYFFKKLGTKYDKTEIVNFLVSHFIIDGNCWIGNISVNKSKTYSEWKNKQQSMSFVFTNEMDALSDIQQDFDSLFKVTNGQHPIILKEYLAGNVSLESMVILQKLINYVPYFTSKISEPIVWPEVKKLVVKYEPFLSVDKPKYKRILINTWNSLITK
jgi:hypothetical protein|tara:strand:+ start:2198 stop:2800 length:603 start_codon:yes stop_codon:yes gene_type:complete